MERFVICRRFIIVGRWANRDSTTIGVAAAEPRTCCYVQQGSSFDFWFPVQPSGFHRIFIAHVIIVDASGAGAGAGVGALTLVLVLPSLSASTRGCGRRPPLEWRGYRCCTCSRRRRYRCCSLCWCCGCVFIEPMRRYNRMVDDVVEHMATHYSQPHSRFAVDSRTHEVGDTETFYYYKQFPQRPSEVHTSENERIADYAT